MDALVVIAILSFLVFIHELGHFITARWSGIKVEEFGFGYPPRILKIGKWKGTLFSINLIPVGGFVRMKGEEPAAEHKPIGDEFYATPWPKRLVVILAGASVNLVFGILAFTLVYGVIGVPKAITEPLIGVVAPNSPAAQAGVPTRVIIKQFVFSNETISVATVKEVIDVVNSHRGQSAQLVTSGTCDGLDCQEPNQTFAVYLRAASETPRDEGALGVMFEPAIYQHYPWYLMPVASARAGISEALGLSRLILNSLGQLAASAVRTGNIPDDLAGPVGIVHQATTSGLVRGGWLSLVSFAGMLSINLAIMNVLPIPPLDGGRALFILAERLVGHRKSRKLEIFSGYAGYILLFGLLILISARDIWRVFM